MMRSVFAACGCFLLAMAESSLEKARKLEAPAAISQSGGEFEEMEFWSANEKLLEEAWQEYGHRHPALYDPGSIDHYIGSSWREVVQKQRASPDGHALSSLKIEKLPGVHSLETFFTDDFRQHLLQELDYLSASGIPQRRPNGMNRYGAILTDLGFQPFFNALAREYLVPIILETFPSTARREDLQEIYAFVVRYREGEDLDLAIHGDASCVCLGKTFTGGQLAFEPYTPGFGKTHRNESKRETFTFEPGTAIIHRGQHRHEALPLLSGERINLVLWFSGEGGYVRIAEYQKEERHSLSEIWQGVSDEL